MWLSHQGALSEDGLLAHLRVLQALLSQLPVSPARASGQDAASDSDEEEGERQSPPLEVSDGEADGLEPGPGLLHGETGRGPSLGPALTLATLVPHPHPNRLWLLGVMKS